MKLPTGQALHWLGGDSHIGDATLDGDTLTLQAGAGTDWFIDPATLEQTATAPVLVSSVDGDCQVTALVTVGFEAMFDAGVLFVHQTNERYAKLCFELSPEREQTVVSVVTQAVSDDANGPVIQGGQVWLRVSTVGSAIAFHWSADGTWWNLLRYFRFAAPTAPLLLGFCSQSPTGEGCTSRFSQISWAATRLLDVRDGS